VTLRPTEAVSEFRVATLAWGLGDVFTTGYDHRLRIIDLLPVPVPVPEWEADDLRLACVWLVEPADASARGDVLA
jgi:hypothetical protein